MIKTLCQLSADYERVLDLCYDESVSDEEIKAELAQLEDELNEKVSAIRRDIQTLKATITRAEAEIEVVLECKRVLENRALYIRENLVPF